MGRNSRRQPTRFRVGEVSYYQHHNAWYLYYRDGGRPVRQRIGTSKDEAAAAAAQVNAQLAAALPTFFSFKPILVDDLSRLYLDYHEYSARSAIGTIDRYRTALRHFQAYLKSTGRARLAHEVDVDGLVRHLRGLKVSPNGHRNSRKRPLRDKGIRQSKIDRSPGSIGTTPTEPGSDTRSSSRSEANSYDSAIMYHDAEPNTYLAPNVKRRIVLSSMQGASRRQLQNLERNQLGPRTPLVSQRIEESRLYLT